MVFVYDFNNDAMRGMGQLKVKLASNVDKGFILGQRPYFVETLNCSVVHQLNCSRELAPCEACQSRSSGPGSAGMRAMGPQRWMLGCWEPVACPATFRLYTCAPDGEMAQLSFFYSKFLCEVPCLCCLAAQEDESLRKQHCSALPGS